MVAVRSAHLNTAGEFALDEWIASLGLPNPQSCERLAATWRYCEHGCLNIAFFLRTLLLRLRYNSALPLQLRSLLHLFRFLPTATRITAILIARQAR